MSGLHALNPEQRAVVMHRDGPLQVVAGPGSGKTRVMTHRIAQLVASGADSATILAITFTNRAANEMLHRTQRLLAGLDLSPRRESAWSGEPGGWSGTPEGPRIATFHAFCARLLRQEIYHLPPYRIDFSIYDTDDQKSVIEEALAHCDLESRSFPAAACLSTVSRWKNELVAPEEAHDDATTHRERSLARVYQTYQRLLLERNALDFDDLLIVTLRLLRENALVRDRRRTLHRYVMVDEFQDTNRPQYLIARLLASEHRNLCITGDPDQSIYSWRGASPDNFLRFAEDFPEHTTVELNRNYRSTPEILQVASRLTEQGIRPRELTTGNPSGAPVQCIETQDEREEAIRIVERIAAWHGAGTPYGECAVLYRLNALSRSIEEELVRGGIPYQVIGGIAFYHRREVKDILAFLRAAVHPHDDVALRRIINLPARGIGKATLDRLIDRAAAAGLSLGEFVRAPDAWDGLPERVRKGLGELERLCAQAIALRGTSLAEQLRAVIEVSRYEEHLQRSEPESWEERRQNLQELVAAAAETEELLQRVHGARGRDLDVLPFFLERVALVSDLDGWARDTDRVPLLTLHSAKGLEFDHVQIAGVEAHLIPHRRALDESDPDEERRLLYVGLTRARRTAVLLHARRRRRFRFWEDCLPSPFLAEIAGPGLVDTPLVARWGEDTDVQTSWPRRRAVSPFADEFPDGGLEDDELHPGVWIEHEQYGRGEVVRAAGFGMSRRVTVRFPAHGTRVFVPAHTPYRIVGAPS